MSNDQPIPALLSLIERTGDLKQLPRMGWLLAGLTNVESVADHTAGVGLLALFLAEAINAEPATQGLDARLDIAVVLQLALIHDLAESVLTDLPKRSTHYLGDAVKHKAEAAILQDLLERLPNGRHYVTLWQSYAHGTTPESRLVKDVDKLEMVAQALRYSERGHQNLHEFWEDHRWFYPLCRTIHEAMLRQWLPGFSPS